ncbi:PAS domain S-box protein [Mucilaginibacter terrenus]|uniref:histidine kinase n=1 Tax=Mucilaginibacter terrenus TaxID=2482727 RepID=A0A3E2NQ67_9SPHI|nr:PAS domain-containing sensor histidine kinase [Mucilaginibacter terrenus]RFZ83144.1 PAS domain S-box protein [Mucilaginibacter terrenus]
MDDIFKVILEQNLAGYWDYYVQENKVIYSTAFKALFGYDDVELPGSTETWSQLIVDEDRAKMDACVAAHFSSQGKIPFNVEVRYKHKNGSIIWIKSSGKVIEWEGNLPIRMVGCHIDITESKQIELELAISEQRFRNAFEWSSIGMVLVSTDGKFMKVNQSLCDMLGYTNDELMSTTFQEITHPEDLEVDLELMHQTLKGDRKNYQMEKRYFRKDGRTIWILLNVSLVRDHDNTPLYFVSQIKDITQRKTAEDALRESERRWSFAIEGSGGGLWDLDLRNKTIYHSQQCLRMIGMENENFGNVIGDWTSRVHPDDKAKFLADAHNYFNGVTQSYENQHRILCKDGTYKWILDRGKVIEYDEDGKPARIIGTHTDITSQKQQEQQLRDTLDMISGQNNRLLNFAYIVSHNLRTHASNFKMLMDVVSDPTTTEQEKKEMTDHLGKVSEQLNETIDNLNEVVSIQSNIDIQTVELNLHDYFQRAILLLQNEINKCSAKVNNYIPSEITVNYSPAYLESIVHNLLSNAIKYRSPERQPQISIDYFNEAAGKRGFTIKDNGIGIDLNRHGSELFGMYKTFNGNRDAKGMGLFITKNQIEAFGGKIDVNSTPGEGSVFKVYLT